MTPYYDEGGITIFHADCRMVLPDLSYDAVVSDPPYGITFRTRMDGAFGDGAVLGDEDTSLRDWALGLAGDRPALVFGSWKQPRPAGTRMVLIWDKGGHVGMGDLALPWKPTTEEIYVIGSGFVGERSSGVLRYPAIAGTVAIQHGRRHPTEKPVSLMRDLLGKCPPEWVIVDPFMGSGSTLRAAKDLGRRAIGIEVEEKYCAAAAERLSQTAMFFVNVA